MTTRHVKRMEVELYSFADQLEHNSMDESEDDAPPIKKSRKSRTSLSRRTKRVGTPPPPKRRRTTTGASPKVHQLPKVFTPPRDVSPSRGNPLFDLLEKNYDLPPSPFRGEMKKSGGPASGSADSESEEMLSESDGEPGRRPKPPPTAQGTSAKGRVKVAVNLVIPARDTESSCNDEDDAETESETEAFVPAPQHSTKPARQQRTTSDSDTEDEAEQLFQRPDVLRIMPQPKRQPEEFPSSESDTESETEALPILPTALHNSVDNYGDLQWRPAFATTEEQQGKGPLVLDKDVRVTKSIAQFLRPYQEDGVKFFWDRYKEGRGGILGDDMGLGKTIQVISFLSAIMGKKGNRTDENRRYRRIDQLLDTHSKKNLPPANAEWPTCLIIAPKTVVGNWVRELQTWGYFEVGVYEAPHKEAVLNSFKMGRYDILLMGHEAARNDMDLIDTLKLSCIFVDEAHKIKNPRASITQKYNQFECTVRFGLTGTAIQNSYQEIWPLMDWSNPGRLGTEKQWQKYIVHPLTAGQSRDSSEKELLEFRDLADRFVNKLLPHFFLRRTKDLIQDQLPRKFDHIVFCPLTQTQVDVYKRILATDEVQAMTRKDEPCDCGARDPKTRQPVKRGSCHYAFIEGPNGEKTPWNALSLKYIDILIKISNSLILIWPGPNDTHEQAKRNSDLIKIAFPNGHRKYGQAIFDTELCGKWSVLSNLLKVWKDEDNANKVLIFSKTTKLLSCLETWLDSAGYSFRLLDGEVKQEDRFKRIDEFNLDPEVYIFLISTLTGGTGLNLVAANKVVIFDPNWNPAHDLQAMDRAYRFGQRRDVSVYRLLGAGSLEELIYARQIYKQQQMKIGYTASYQTRLFAGIQGDKQRQGELFGLKNLFSLKEELATKEQIEEAHMSNLEWALAHTTSSSRGDQDDVIGGKMLESFLFDDADVERARAKMGQADPIKQILDSHGVKYTHENDHILRDNVVEKSIAQAARKGKRARAPQGEGSQQRKPAGGETDTPPEKKKRPLAQWPPVRRHHTTSKVPSVLTPHERRLARKKALYESGAVKDEADHARFAEEFASKEEAEQIKILEQLDRFHQERRSGNNQSARSSV